MQERLALAIANLDAWLETMRQAGGYGGPVAHWWQNRFQFAGPALDWRYEGILAGYTTLFDRTGQPTWRDRVRAAVQDLVEGQAKDGHYRASRFEINPGTLGTPHEAAASYGLLLSLPQARDPAPVLDTVERNLDHLVGVLWDGRGFVDRPGARGRVPNKLATMALALMTFSEATGEERYLPYARSALQDIVRMQDERTGAIHQSGSPDGRGDGRFFPFYNARCIPALMMGARRFADDRCRRAADGARAFLRATMDGRGRWPQVIYRGGRRADWPAWAAGRAEILHALEEAGDRVPDEAILGLLDEQQPSGGFGTGSGFVAQIRQRRPAGAPDFRDVVPVVGWNDKVLRLLASRLEPGARIPPPSVGETRREVRVGGRVGEYHETADRMSVTSGSDRLYRWNKQQPWASQLSERCRIR